MPEISLHHNDNFSFLPADSVDFLLTDPPFNISKKTNFASYEKNTIHSYQFDGASGQSWDTYTHEEFLLKLDEWSSEWARVIRKGGNFAIFCADAYISHLFESLKRSGLSPRRLITWRKNNAVPVNRQYMPMSASEYIVVGVKEGKNVVFNSDVNIKNQTLDEKIIEATVVADKVSTIVYSQVKTAILASNSSFSDPGSHINLIANLLEEALEKSKVDSMDKVRSIYKSSETKGVYFQACVPNYVQHPIKVGNRLHPTEKPVPLLQYLIALYSKPGDVVLDSFAGSGSTGEAARSLGRQAILIEREMSYFNAMTQRLEPDSALFTIAP